MVDEARLRPHRKVNPQGCERCRESHRHVAAEWNLKPPGRQTMYLCGPHARYWAGVYGLQFGPGEPLHATP